MDTKSLARSKRAHSLHHSKKHHPSPKPKTPSGAPSGSATADKAPGKQAPEKAQSRPKPKLPSNWDRYEEEEIDSGLAEGSEVQVSDVPAPRSKGADYRYLIAEAEAQSQSHSVSGDSCVDSFVSLGDVLPEFFGRGASALGSVRGEAVLSSASEDSFVVDDKATSGHEVPFLSLNLNALAEQLAKVDLAKLLFIEPDLLPPEMQTGLYIASNEKTSDPMQTHKTEAAKGQLDVLDDFAWDERKEEEPKESGTGRSESDSVLNFLDDNISADTSEVSSLRKTIVPEPTDQSIKKSDIDQEKRNSAFEAAAAEAELDTLLNSFDETRLTEPSGSCFPESTPALQDEMPTSVPRASGRGFISSVATPVPDSAKIDVLLDDLLEETSNFAQQYTQPSVSQTPQVNSVARVVKSSPIVTGSKELEDFDSWLDTI